MMDNSASPGKDLVEELLDAMPPPTTISQSQIDRLARVIRATAREETLGRDHLEPHVRFPLRAILTARYRMVYAASLLLVMVLGGAVAVHRYFMTVEAHEWTPDQVTLSDNRQIAYLVARNGRTIHAWGTPVAAGIRAGALVNAPTSAGRGDLAVLGFSQGSENPHPHQFAVYRVKDSLHRPWWTASLTMSDIPPDLMARPGRQYGVDQFVARVCRSADIFPEIPGVELVLVFQHGVYSQCAVQIRDLDGNLLYQAWHDGNVHDVYWMAAPRQLVCAAFNAEADGVDRGLGHLRHPHVAFALLPQHGEKIPRWINTPDHRNGVEPEWYLCLIEPEGAPEPVLTKLTGPHAGEDAKTHVVFSVDFSTPVGSGGFSVLINDAGIVAPPPFLTNDGYNRAVKRSLLPPADSYRMEPLPAIQDRTNLWIPGQQDEAARQ